MNSTKTASPSVHSAGSAGAEALPLKAGSRQLFLDDYLIEPMRGVRRALHIAQKHPANPLIVADKPWESKEVILYGSVLREPDGLWRIWYLSHFHNGADASGASRVHHVDYAESDDGVLWRKPEMDVFRYKGERTNVVMGMFTHPDFREFHGVVRDEECSARQYKTVFHTIGPCKDGTPGGDDRHYYTACSPDGVHWGDVRRIPVRFPVNPDIGQFVRDPLTGRYVIWARAKFAPDAVRARAPKGWWGRAVAMLTSEDFVHWEDHGVAMAADLDDPPAMDIYSLAAFRCGELWVGLPQVYFQFPDDHRLEVQLAASRDGTHWTRFEDRRAILPLGGPGEWDRFNHATATMPVETDREWRLYYSGRTYRHVGYEGNDSGDRFAAIGMASWRREGFVSMDASFDGGTIVTRPLLLGGPALFLNIKSDYGSVAVQALDMTGAVLATAGPLTVDDVRVQVPWNYAKPAARMAGQPVRLRLTLHNASLYSLWCE